MASTSQSSENHGVDGGFTGPMLQRLDEMKCKVPRFQERPTDSKAAYEKLKELYPNHRFKCDPNDVEPGDCTACIRRSLGAYKGRFTPAKVAFLRERKGRCVVETTDALYEAFDGAPTRWQYVRDKYLELYPRDEIMCDSDDPFAPTCEVCKLGMPDPPEEMPKGPIAIRLPG
ncbi:hypothetical protein BDY21DRAFT_418055 [Lineolata rhizophorae]|uniref:Uncharacterized protein n=1 Tax=Lineolata rhizophorae TaxID=578093 RepID=A0A6A6PDM7_9PEZI|nr:hypothetical protein BDY21DRAFT_418055 [Lineolata rhizophorae]